jgi:hypothetical protein
MSIEHDMISIYFMNMKGILLLYQQKHPVILLGTLQFQGFVGSTPLS